MKNLFKILSLTALVVAVFTSCQKDEAVVRPDAHLQDQEAITYSYEDVFNKDEPKVRKKGAVFTYSIFYKRHTRHPRFGWVGSPDVKEFRVLDTGTQLWLRDDFNDANVFVNEVISDGYFFVKYPDLQAQVEHADFEKQCRFYWDAECMMPIKEDIVGQWTIPTHNDVNLLASHLGSFQYVKSPDALDISKSGVYMDGDGLVARNSICDIWLKANPLIPKSDIGNPVKLASRPYDTIRFTDQGTGSPYPDGELMFGSIMTNHYAQIRLVFNYTMKQ